MAFEPIPVFMRIGDGAEYEVGAITPELKLALPTEGNVITDISFPLSDFLRGMADIIDEGK